MRTTLRISIALIAFALLFGVAAFGQSDADAAPFGKTCKKIQAACTAGPCTQGAPLAGDTGCYCNNSCTCTGSIQCYVGAIVVETHDCAGACIRTMYEPDGQRPVDNVAAFSIEPLFVDQETCIDDTEVAPAQKAAALETPATAETEAARR